LQSQGFQAQEEGSQENCQEESRFKEESEEGGSSQEKEIIWLAIIDFIIG